MQKMISRHLVVVVIIGAILAMLLYIATVMFSYHQRVLKDSETLFWQIEHILDQNRTELDEVMEEYRATCLLRAKTVAYVIEKKPELINDREALRHLAQLMEIDEIHIIDAYGRIYAGTVPKYYNYTLNSGEQMRFFLPMLKDKSLELWQGITPNTAEAKPMQYAAVWSKDGKNIVEIGMEPLRVLKATAKNELSSIFSLLTDHTGAALYAFDSETGNILGTNRPGLSSLTLDILRDRIAGKEEGHFHSMLNHNWFFCCYKKMDSAILVRTVSVDRMYESILRNCILFAFFMTAISAFLYFSIKRHLGINIVSTIMSINSKLSRVAAHNYEDFSETYSIPEFNLLNEHINEMLHRIRTSVHDLQGKLDLENSLRRSITALTHESDPEHAMKAFLQNIGHYYHADRAYIFELDEDSHLIHNTYEWCADGISPQKDAFQNIPFEDVADWLEKFGRNESVRIPAVSRITGNARQREMLEKQDIQHLLVTGIYRNNEVIGFLGVDNPGNAADDPTLLRLNAECITEEFTKKILQNDLQSLYFTDRLTGLWNRRKYMQKLEKYLKNPPKTMGIFFVDLDGLKNINESFGHDVGDQYICQCAKAVKKLVKDVFRIAGDEFVALLPDVSETDFHALELKLRQVLKKLPSGSASVGAVWEKGRINIPEMVSLADNMMFAEKQIYYRTAASEEHMSHLGLATDVLQDIQSGRFEAFFQPQIDLATGTLYGAEALVRKRDENGNIIPPDQFIPLYEADGVISHMDLHILEQVCDTLKRVQADYGRVPTVSVNFSRITLMETGIVARVRAVCDKYGVAPENIMIEVTESTGKLTCEQLSTLVGEFQQAGFSVSLDDFGSRHSNLSTLSMVNFQLVKLDKSLVDHIETDQRCCGIVKSLIYMCKNVIMTPVLCEGVEVEGQMSLLKSYACDYIQGYYFSRPIPREDFVRLIAENYIWNV